MLNKGYKIGQYELLNQVGSGGFGDVWKAEKRTALDVNYFALKFFRPKDDHIDFDKIGKELAVWKRLKGLPHIISVIELDRFDDYVYVVSDFADGGSLESWLKDNGGKASSEAEAVKITLEILTGLENLHDKGFVHRDLKPDNILIMNGKFCLADFGVSREIKTHSKATGTAGTMEYMPPEAFAKTPSITPQTDIWAVGVIFQKLLTGELPYPQEDYPSLIAAITMFEPEPMPETVPEGLREIVKKALQKESGNRFQSAGAMRDALKHPQQFLAEQIAKAKNSETIDDEDFEKTKPLELPITEDWQEIEAKRQQDELNKIQRKLESERHDHPTNLWKWIVGGVCGFVLFVFGIIGIVTDNNVNKPANKTPKATASNKDDSATSTVNSTSSSDYFNLAYDCGEKKDYDCAIKNYTKAIELKSDYAEAYYNRGSTYDDKRNYDQAIADYTKAIELKPDYANAYYNRGIAYKKKGNYDQAIQDFSKAIELKPDYVNAYILRGNSYDAEGNYDQAIAEYRKALQIDQNSKIAKDNLEKVLKKKNRQ